MLELGWIDSIFPIPWLIEPVDSDVWSSQNYLLNFGVKSPSIIIDSCLQSQLNSCVLFCAATTMIYVHICLVIYC